MRPALLVSLTTAASLFGDTLLYTALPVNAERLGIGALLVGVALSVNRFVRLGTNLVAGRLFERLPAGRLVVAAILVAALTTGAYALTGLLAVFLLARLVWGACWSVLRLGSYLSAIEDARSGVGRGLGEMRANFGVGYLAGVVYAPFAVERFGWGGAAIGAAALTIAFGLPPALGARSWRRSAATPRGDGDALSALDPSIVLLSVIGAAQYGLYSGVLLVVGGLRIAELYPAGGAVGPLVLTATFLAAAYVLAKRLAEVLWTAFAGRLADRAAGMTFAAGSAAAALGIATLALRLDATSFLAAGAIAFVGGVTSAIAVELALARRCGDADRPRILAWFGSWTDAGAAVGALGGGALALVGTAPALGLAALVVAGTFPLWWLAERRPRMVTA